MAPSTHLLWAIRWEQLRAFSVTSEVLETPTQAAPETTQTTPEPSPDDEALAFLDKIEKPDDGTATSDDGTASESPNETQAKPDPVRDELLEAEREAAREEVRREERERLQKEQREQAEAATKKAREDSLKADFQTRAQEMRALAKGLDLSDEQTNEFVNHLEQHHGQARIIAATEMTDALVARMAENLPESERQAYIDKQEQARREGTWTVEGAVSPVKDAVIAEARDGYVTKAESRKEKAQAVYEFSRNREQLVAALDALDSGENPPQSRSGTPTSGLTIQMLRSATPEQYEQMKERYGSEAISRVYMRAGESR